MELNAHGAVHDRIIRSPNGRLIRSNRYGWYLFNVRGDVVQRVNDARVVQRVYRYSAFGIEHLPSANNTNNFRFAGEYFDAETGNYYLRARFFNPRTGRWNRPDPFFHARFGNLQSCIIQAGNLYMFVMHNPVMFIDPWGLYSVMLQYIVEKNNGTMSFRNPRFYCAVATGYPVFVSYSFSLNVTIGDTSRSFSEDEVSIVDGRILVNHELLMNEFGLTQAQATHQPWDAFSSPDSAAIAFSLMHTGHAQDMISQFHYLEIGAMIYSVNTGSGRNRRTHYTFGNPWVGGVITGDLLGANVVVGLGSRFISRESGRPRRSSMVALAHTHPTRYTNFSSGDRTFARFLMPIYMSRIPYGGGLHVSIYTHGVGSRRVFTQ